MTDLMIFTPPEDSFFPELISELIFSLNFLSIKFIGTFNTNAIVPPNKNGKNIFNI